MTSINLLRSKQAQRHIVCMTTLKLFNADKLLQLEILEEILALQHEFRLKNKKISISSILSQQRCYIY